MSAFAAFLAIGAYTARAIISLVIDGLVIFDLSQAPTAEQPRIPPAPVRVPRRARPGRGGPDRRTPPQP